MAQSKRISYFSAVVTVILVLTLLLVVFGGGASAGLALPIALVVVALAILAYPLFCVHRIRENTRDSVELLEDVRALMLRQEEESERIEY